jgi:hypothetical protein
MLLRPGGEAVVVDTVRGELIAAVQDAFEPAHVSVWLTATTAGSR